MIKQYPKAIYNNADKATTTVSSKENHEIVKGYFKDELDFSLVPYTGIKETEALRMYADAKAEAVKEIEKVKEEEKPEPQLDDKLRSLSYLELITYAKQIMKEKGVKFPVRATRDSIEKSIREVLNGDND